MFVKLSHITQGYILNENFRTKPHKQNKYWGMAKPFSPSVKLYSYPTGRRILKTNSYSNTWVVHFVYKNILYQWIIISMVNYVGTKLDILEDFLGIFCLSFKLVCFVLLSSKIRTKGQWSSPPWITCIYIHLSKNAIRIYFDT